MLMLTRSVGFKHVPREQAHTEQTWASLACDCNGAMVQLLKSDSVHDLKQQFKMCDSGSLLHYWRFICHSPYPGYAINNALSPQFLFFIFHLETVLSDEVTRVCSDVFPWVCHISHPTEIQCLHWLKCFLPDQQPYSLTLVSCDIYYRQGTGEKWPGQRHISCV